MNVDHNGEKPLEHKTVNINMHIHISLKKIKIKLFFLINYLGYEIVFY